MDYNYETIEIDIEAIENCCENIVNTKLKEIAEAAKENITQLAIVLALPHFLMSKGVREIKYFQYLLEGAVATKSRLQPESPEEQIKLDGFIKTKFEENKESHSEEGRKLLTDLRNNHPHIENAIRILALNSLVNIWTVFESTSKDIWIYILNNFQDKFLNNVLEAKTIEDIEGITGKSISIQFLAKYGFNINNKLGDILSNKYDFTSCSGIKKGYLDIDKSQKDSFAFLNDRDLFQLELIRNLIVHNAGIIDDIYIRKSLYTDQNIGNKLTITSSEFAKYENAAIHGLIKMLEFADNINKL